MSTSTPPEEQPDRDGPVPPVSDEQWTELVRRAEAGDAGAPKEPSARARMVTARLRALDEEAARAQGAGRRWGRKPRQVEPWQPDGWRTGPEWQRMNGRPRKRRRLAGTLGFVAVVGILVIAMRPSLLTGRLPGGDDAAGTTPLSAESAPPTAAPPHGTAGDRPTPEEPFLGSPAIRWADGAAGIEVPEAKAVGGISEDQVAYALRTTRQLLVDANLDASTLRGENPREALALLDPLQEDGREHLALALAEPDEKRDPVAFFSRFAPSEARQLGDVVKVRGRTTFEAGRPGSVEVHADYTFVYPVVKAGNEDEVARTIVRRRVTTVLYDPRNYEVTPGKLSLLRYESRAGNSACEVYDGFLHPAFDSDAQGREPGGDLVDPYDRSTWPSQEDCSTVSRS
ncbi:hypothetical protein ACIRJR_06445 [Streptomyces sp. NPDC102402]|uniref:hypothetical protein n=1 Tax=Streptomyces sp. NPDC102402 TaxID=3366169 RepID=UPI003808D943